MKSRYFCLAILILLITSCAPGANSPLKEHMLAYNWKITYAKHNNIVTTNLYSNYVFNFEPNDLVIASRPDSTFNGSWIRSNSSETNPKVQLNFGSHYQLGLLNYDWQMDLRSDILIKFVDDMSAGATEAVNFERIN
jgi:hypothetical protein